MVGFVPITSIKPLASNPRDGFCSDFWTAPLSFTDMAAVFPVAQNYLQSIKRMASEHPVFRRASNRTLLLKASDEARALGPPKEPHRAKSPEEVEREARAHVTSQGGDVNNPTLVLSRWKIQFGKYQDRTFHWLLENDVGYAINLVSSHQKERERTGSQSPLMANKDGLIRYSSAYPDFVEAVRFHQAFEEARVRSLQPGQEGQALVGFGDFKTETLQSLYESEDPKKIRFVKYLRRKVPAPGTQMENAIRFIKARDKQKAAAVSSAPAASASASAAAAAAIPSTSSSSSASASAPPGVVATAAHRFTAFVSGRRSLSVVEMQAKVKKLVGKPAFPASSRPASSSAASEEPTEEELVSAVVDIESSHVQAPPAPGAPPPPLDVVAEEQPAPAGVPPPPSAGNAELLPESWRAALTAEQQQWIGRVLFSRDSSGKSRLTTELNLWWNPPQPRPIYNQPPASPNFFFACRLFLWMPHRIWCLQLTCPQPLCDGSLTKAGLYRTIRRVLDIDGWYLMATEYLECRRCKKKVGGWSQGIIRQLAPTYSCQFPAVLTYKLSCDQRVIAQLRQVSHVGQQC
ncbi:uncharacterized protein LOC112136815 [Oryzias melastigma]|uniref:uncharacterized protein LOC112136815 n=1 Tax=Oryzias melastigma TaxID=30732 RepID=UPI000CF7C642|nr:uncharacterized protein LOC112136815 [Oryzias melastigma]